MTRWLLALVVIAGCASHPILPPVARQPGEWTHSHENPSSLWGDDLIVKIVRIGVDGGVTPEPPASKVKVVVEVHAISPIGVELSADRLQAVAESVMARSGLARVSRLGTCIDDCISMTLDVSALSAEGEDAVISVRAKTARTHDFAQSLDERTVWAPIAEQVVAHRSDAPHNAEVGITRAIEDFIKRCQTKQFDDIQCRDVTSSLPR